MRATMDPKVRALVHKMLKGLAGEPLVPADAANAAFAIMCLALSKMSDARQREDLLTKLDPAARDRVASLMREAQAGDGPSWLQ
jgi:hypothetical protein